MYFRYILHEEEKKQEAIAELNLKEHNIGYPGINPQRHKDSHVIGTACEQMTGPLILSGWLECETS